MTWASNIKILIVDDSRTIRRSAELLLQKEGFQVETAEDGFDALPKIIQTQPNIIFLDIMMPRLDGYQTCAIIKNHPEFKHIPVVMLSSKDGLFDRARGVVVGANKYVTKPFNREEILEVLKALLPA